MDPLSITAVGSAGAMGLGSVLGGIGSYLTGREQNRLGRETLAYQKEMQRQAWRREDNAVQRRAADLKAAGINPILAAGSAASASGPITPVTPQATPSPFEAIGKGASGIGSAVEKYYGVKQLQNSIAQQETALQTAKLNNDLLNQNIRKTSIENKILQKDFNIYEDTNLKSGTSVWNALPGLLSSSGRKLADQIFQSREESALKTAEARFKLLNMVRKQLSEKEYKVIAEQIKKDAINQRSGK